MKNAEEGKVFHIPVIAGNTTREEAEKMLGSPEKIEKSPVGEYADYPAHHLSLGFDGPLVFDIRSYDERLSAIHLQDIENGTDAVMIVHILLPQIDQHYPASMSKTVITNLLRKKLGYNEVVITDVLTMKAITNQYSLEKAAIFSLKAGSDIVLIAHHEEKISSVLNQLISAVKRGEISEHSPIEGKISANSFIS